MNTTLLLSAATIALISTCSAQSQINENIEALTTVKAAESSEQMVSKEDWLSQFYAEKKMQPLWVGNRRNKKRLHSYLETLSAARAFGLDPERYGYSSLKKASGQANTGEQTARLDLMASRSFVNFALDIRDGAVSPRIDMTETELAGRQQSQGDILNSFAESGNVEKFFKGLRKDNPVQKHLVSALHHYEELRDAGGWETVSINGDKIEIGYAGDDVPAIAERLRIEGFFDGKVTMQEVEAEGEKPMPLYDKKLAEAVERFQESRGIIPDGIVGENTLARMNETAEDLISSIRLNIERARWLPQDFGDRYVLVNIARYTAGLYEDEKLEREIGAIVGKDHTQTPVFAGSMSYLVANPYWNIPESITRGEIAPKMAKDRTYIASKNMEVIDGWSQDPQVIDVDEIDWDDLPSPLNFRIRQKPGGENALGNVKFMFPNEYSVYLHDTPTEYLFDETKRAFSHGCIRLEDPKAMADWVLAETKDHSGDKIFDIIENSDEETNITLDKEIPVYVTYFTAWANADGDVFFLDDLYDRDEKLRTALEKSRDSYEISIAP